MDDVWDWIALHAVILFSIGVWGTDRMEKDERVDVQ